MLLAPTRSHIHWLRCLVRLWATYGIRTRTSRTISLHLSLRQPTRYRSLMTEVLERPQQLVIWVRIQHWSLLFILLSRILLSLVRFNAFCFRYFRLRSAITRWLGMHLLQRLQFFVRCTSSICGSRCYVPRHVAFRFWVVQERRCLHEALDWEGPCSEIASEQLICIFGRHFAHGFGRIFITNLWTPSRFVIYFRSSSLAFSIGPLLFLHSSCSILLSRCLFKDLVIPLVIIQLYTNPFLPGYDTYNTCCASSSSLFLFLDMMHQGRLFLHFTLTTPKHFFLLSSSHSLPSYTSIPLRQCPWCCLRLAFECPHVIWCRSHLVLWRVGSWSINASCQPTVVESRDPFGNVGNGYLQRVSFYTSTSILCLVWWSVIQVFEALGLTANTPRKWLRCIPCLFSRLLSNFDQGNLCIHF